MAASDRSCSREERREWRPPQTGAARVTGTGDGGLGRGLPPRGGPGTAASDRSCSHEVRVGVGAGFSGWRQGRFTPEGDRP